MPLWCIFTTKTQRNTNKDMQVILENLYKAYFEARKNKRFTKEQLKFEQNYEHQLQLLYEQIITKTYKVAPCKAICFFIHFIQVFKNISYICRMQSAQKHTFINAKNLQGSKFFRTFKYFLAQHSLKQLIFSLLLCCGLFSFAQEENTTTFYVNPNTTIVGLDNLNQSTKFAKLEKEQGKIYISANTIFFSSQNLATVTIKESDESQKLSANKKYKFSKENRLKTKEQLVKVQRETQVTQTPFPFSLLTDQKQTIVTAISTTTVTTSTFAKTSSKTFAIHNSFSLPIRKVLSQKQNTICYNENSKPFQIKLKHCNRPPPAIYC